MTFIKLASVVAAVAAGAAAQCEPRGVFTITANGDEGRIAPCTTFTGSIAIATGVTAVNLAGPERVTGDIRAVQGGMLSSLSAPNLRIIDGTLFLRKLNLQSVSMPEITQIDAVDFQSTGPNLLGLDFGEGLQQVTNLSIADTFLQNLDGIDLVTADSVQVVSNQLLSTLTMQLRNTTGPITIRGNNEGLVVNLNNLKSCGNLNVNQCSQLMLRSLNTTSGVLAINENNFEDLLLPNLTSAVGGFQVSMNPQLSNLSIPLLQTVASLDILGNDKLDSDINFPALERVTGAINVTGSFTGLNFPVLNRVDGTAYFRSTEDIQDSCSAILEKGTRVFATQPRCGTLRASDSPSPSGTDDSGSGSGSNPTDTGNAALHYPASTGNTYGIFGLLAFLFGLLM